MKTNISTFRVYLICICILAVLTSKAQTPQNVAKHSPTITIVRNGVVHTYTYYVFQAPNKLYGYDIFENGKGVFHQTVPENISDQSALNKKEYAEKAALLSIEKLKNKTSPAL